MTALRPFVGWFGFALAASSVASVGAAHTRAEHPPVAPVAVTPWLDVAITGAIGERAARASTAGRPGRRPAPVEREPEDAAEALLHRVDPPRHEFGFPLRGPI